MAEHGRAQHDPESLLTGRVRLWHVNEGWGVIDTPALDKPVWTHFSHIDADGFRSLSPGARVVLTAEAADQDGFSWRAIWVREEKL